MQVLTPERDCAPASGLQGLSRNRVGDRNTAVRLEFCPGWLSEAKATAHPGVRDTQVARRQWPGGAPSSSPGPAQGRRAAVRCPGREAPEQRSGEARLRVQQQRQTRTQKRGSRLRAAETPAKGRGAPRRARTEPGCVSTTLSVNGHGPSGVRGTHQEGCESEAWPRDASRHTYHGYQRAKAEGRRQPQQEEVGRASVSEPRWSAQGLSEVMHDKGVAPRRTWRP